MDHYLPSRFFVSWRWCFVLLLNWINVSKANIRLQSNSDIRLRCFTAVKVDDLSSEELLKN